MTVQDGALDEEWGPPYSTSLTANIFTALFPFTQAQGVKLESSNFYHKLAECHPLVPWLFPIPLTERKAISMSETVIQSLMLAGIISLLKPTEEQGARQKRSNNGSLHVCRVFFTK